MTQIYDNVNFDSESHHREVHPQGITKAVCVDIIDLGRQKNQFYDPTNEKSKEFVDSVRLVWESSRRRTDGRPFILKRTFSKSLYDGGAGGKASALYKTLSTWLGAEFDGRFEARKIYGRPAVLVVEQTTKDDKILARVENVLPDDSKDPYVQDGSYKRWIPKEDDGVPF